jgi:two-component system sensor histidine kinase KdpD
MPYLARFVVACAVLGVVTVAARATGIDLAAAALLLLVAVVVLSLLGLPVALVSAALGFVALNWYFTPPKGTFRIADGDDLAALIVFVGAASVVGTVVHLLDRARRQAERREAEARLRIDLANRLSARASIDEALPAIATSLRELFDLTSCRLVLHDGEGDGEGLGERDVRSGDAFTGAPELRVANGPLTLEAHPRRPLDTADRELLEALVAGVATALERLRFETEAREARVAAEVGATRAAFLSGVSHNLRTPLAAVKAAAATLLAPDAHLEPSEHDELLHMIRDESERLERLVRNTLALSRIKGGVFDIAPAVTDAGELVGVALRRVAPLATQHRLRADVPDDLPPVRVDEAVLENVLLNLLENALRFAPAGTEIVVAAAVAAHGALEVRVVDHGPGVPAEERARIFEEFVQGARRDGEGSGLGLAIVQSLVHAHGGSVWVEDTPGGGATFVCTVPQEDR